MKAKEQQADTARLLIGLIALSLIFQASVSLALGSERASTLENADPPEISIHLRNGLVSVEAKDGPWEQLLQEFSRKSGIIFHLKTPLEGTVTASFQGLPLERALQHLFGQGANLMLVYRSGTPTVVSFGLPSEVWIFGGSRRGVANTLAPRETDGDSAPAALEDPDDPAQDPAQDVVREFEGDPLAAREFARGHPDPRVQRVAITYLGEQATAEAIEVLFSLLEDHDSSVRQSALEALGPLVQHHRLVRENLVKILERSEDNDTRQLIADSVGVSLDNILPGQPIALDVLDDAATLDEEAN